MNTRVCAVSFHHVESKHHEVHTSNRKATITHKNFRHCRVSFSPIVRQAFSKQLYNACSGKNLERTNQKALKEEIFRDNVKSKGLIFRYALTETWQEQTSQ